MGMLFSARNIWIWAALVRYGVTVLLSLARPRKHWIDLFKSRQQPWMLIFYLIFQCVIPLTACAAAFLISDLETSVFVRPLNFLFMYYAHYV